MGRKYDLILSQYKNLYTKRLRLRPLTMEDRKDVFEFASDEEVTKYVTWERHKSIDQSANYILNYYSRNGVYGIEHRESKKCIGCIDLRLDIDNDKASLGYMLNKDYWNNGYMSEALNEILRICFEELKLNRVEGEHYVENSASGKVMLKCGMKYEGRAIQEIKVKDKYFDIDHYGIIRDTWISENKKEELA